MKSSISNMAITAIFYCNQTHSVFVQSVYLSGINAGWPTDVFRNIAATSRLYQLCY